MASSALGAPLRGDDFPPGTPLHAFFRWNEARRRPDRRFTIARDLDRLTGLPGAARLRTALSEATASAELAAHAAVFQAFEVLASEFDLAALATGAGRPNQARAPERPRHILIIRLSALGDFVQSLGPAAAIRHHHAGDHITLLTSPALAGFAAQLGLFDSIVTDTRPALRDVAGLVALRRMLRGGDFDRVYDLQTSDRSSAYRWLFWPDKIPEWSGIAWRCSHPHANLQRDQQHTIDKQAEQLLMAGIYPTPLPSLPPLACRLAGELGGPFALLVPGSSPGRLAKRWPASRFGELARGLDRLGLTPVVVGTEAEQPLAAAIRELCPTAIDLVGRTDIADAAALAQRAAVTVGNDTGVSHLAAAARCPLIVLFSDDSDPARCAPRGRLVRVLAEPDLAQLATAPVLAAVGEVLRASAPSPVGQWAGQWA